MISDDIYFARELHRRIVDHPEFEAFTQELSISTFRYVPESLAATGTDREEYLNQLNKELLSQLQINGEVFVSNAVIGGTFVLRACIVNFRTEMSDVDMIPEIIVNTGRELDAQLRPVHS